MEFVLKTAARILWALTLLLATTTATDDGVLLKDPYQNQKITSNTLKWFTPSTSELIPKDAVIGSVEYMTNDSDEMILTNRSQLNEQKVYICRAFLAGIWVPGALYEHNKRCVVTSGSDVKEAELYDILVNTDQAGRLIWENWDRQTEVPVGAVYAGNYYVAHTPSPTLRILSEKVAIGLVYRVGKIDPDEGLFGKLSVLDENKQIVYDVPDGQVLVERQPSLYELTITSFTRAREKVLDNRTLKLGETTLRNDESREMKADSVITYQWDYESSWGQGRAMLKALETRIQFQNSTALETISWGLPYTETKKDCTIQIEKILPPGTSVHVTVNAQLLKKETPYTGIVLSVFNDKNTMNRSVQGIRTYTDLTNIQIVYGPLYFTQNNSIVPTTTTTTTEAPSPTTTIVTTISPADETAPPGSSDESQYITEQDENGATQEKMKDANTNGSQKSTPLRFLLPVSIVTIFCYLSIW